MANRQAILRHLGFGAAFLAGFAVAAFLYLFLAIGECLPRDDSAQMHACDAMKTREFWLFPTLWLIFGSWSLYRHLRRQGGANALALGSAILAWIALGLVNLYA